VSSADDPKSGPRKDETPKKDPATPNPPASTPSGAAIVPTNSAPPAAPLGAATSQPGRTPAIQIHERDLQVFERFLSVQERELQVRMRQMELESSDRTNHKEIALASITAQKDDRKDERQHRALLYRWGTVAALVIALAVICVIVLAMKWNKDALIGDLVKIVAGLLAGTGLGHAIGYSRGMSAERRRAQPPPEQE
jgi:hypothetical protein